MSLKNCLLKKRKRIEKHYFFNLLLKKYCPIPIKDENYGLD